MGFVLGFADSIQGVLLDALGMMFLFYLDDVGGGLTLLSWLAPALLSTRAWPGTRLSYLENKLPKTATTNRACTSCLTLFECFVGLLMIIMPVVFLFTPFKALKPDPFYESIVTPRNFAHAVNSTVVLT